VSHVSTSVELVLFAGLMSSWLPLPYGGPVVTLHPEGGFILSVGDKAGAVIGSVWLPLTLHCSDRGQHEGAPPTETVRKAWLLLCCSAWERFHSINSTHPEGATRP
jgi:hypothetical protein